MIILLPNEVQDPTTIASFSATLQGSAVHETTRWQTNDIFDKHKEVDEWHGQQLLPPSVAYPVPPDAKAD